MAARRPWRVASLQPRPAPSAFAPWLKLAATAVVGAFVPLYWWQAPAGSFLWFYDIALLATLLALWFEWRLLASMMALAVLLPEVAWNVGFFGRLFGAPDLFGLATPVFDAAHPGVQAVALAHVVVPVLLLWMLYRIGYDARALPAQTLLAWSALASSYALAGTPAADFAWTFGVGDNLTRAWLPGWLWLSLAMLAYPVLVYIPTHLVLRALFAAPGVAAARRQRLRPGIRRPASAGAALSVPAEPIDTSARPDRIMNQKSKTPGSATSVVRK